MPATANSTGILDFKYEGESLQTWYRLFGDLASGKTPLVVANGGPGCPHNYVLPHSLLHEQRGIPVILYDQIGTGKSTRLKDKPAEFWAVDLYIAELENLLSLLGINNGFDLLGHSWGGMLAQEFVVKRQPSGLRRLILADTPADMDQYELGVHALLREMPQDLQDTVKKHEEAGTTSAAEYQSACDVFYKQHLCRIDPWPKDLVEGFALMAEDSTVYNTMCAT
jgi:proline-specific peptidase